MVGQPRRNITSYKQLVNKVENMVKETSSEVKFNELVHDDTAILLTVGPPIGYGSTIFDQCTLINQGDGQEQRIGNKIRLKDVTWRFKISLDPSTTSDDVVTYRVLLFIIKNSKPYRNVGLTLADPTLTDYLSNPNVSNVVSTLSMINKDNADNFVILRDKTYTLDEFGTGVSRIHKIYKKLDIVTSYETDADSSPSYNELIACIIPGTSLAAYMFFASYLRVNYTDV